MTRFKVCQPKINNKFDKLLSCILIDWHESFFFIVQKVERIRTFAPNPIS